MDNKEFETLDEVIEEFSKDPEFQRQYRRKLVFFDFAQEIIDCRKLLRITQVELAARARTHQSRISKIESGEHDIRLSTLIQIAAALDTRVEIKLVPSLTITDAELELTLKTPDPVLSGEAEEKRNTS